MLLPLLLQAGSCGTKKVKEFLWLYWINWDKVLGVKCHSLLKSTFAPTEGQWPRPSKCLKLPLTSSGVKHADSSCLKLDTQRQRRVLKMWTSGAWPSSYRNFLTEQGNDLGSFISALNLTVLSMYHYCHSVPPVVRFPLHSNVVFN